MSSGLKHKTYIQSLALHFRHETHKSRDKYLEKISF